MTFHTANLKKRTLSRQTDDNFFDGAREKKRAMEREKKKEERSAKRASEKG